MMVNMWLFDAVDPFMQLKEGNKELSVPYYMGKDL